MGLILHTQFDYDSIRYSLGLEKDQARLLTDDVIEGFSHLPMAEGEAISRYTPPQQSSDVIATLLQRPPTDISLNALKAGICMLTAAFLCPRLENTIPLTQKLNELGEITRVKIDWLAKEQWYISKANWFFSLIDQSLAPHNNSWAYLASGAGRLYKFDPGYYGRSDLSGYIYPSVPFATTGGSDIGAFLYGFTFSI